MKIPRLGKLTQDIKFGWHSSEAVVVSMLNGKDCRLVLKGYDEDPAKEEFYDAAANFFSDPALALKEVETYIFQYYQDINSCFSPSHDEFRFMERPDGVWEYVQFRDLPMSGGTPSGDRSIQSR